MKKKIIIGSLIAVGLVLLVVLCVFLMKPNNVDPANPNPTEETLPTSGDFTMPIAPEPANPSERLQESFVVAKETLGEEYYPSVAMESSEIAEMLKLEFEDYVFLYGQKAQDETKFDMLISIKTMNDESGAKVENLLFDYINSVIADENKPEYIRNAFKGATVLRDTWGYVFLIATFGDVDKMIDKSATEITTYAETNCMKVAGAIYGRVHE